MQHWIRCECNAWECREGFYIDELTYLMARGARSAIVVPGHQEPGERILQRGAGWIIVEDSEP